MSNLGAPAWQQAAAEWRETSAAWETAAKGYEAEASRLRQVLWDIYSATGADTDGDRKAPAPGVMTPDVPELALRTVQEYRRECEAEAEQLERNWRADRDKLVAVREAVTLALDSRLAVRVLGILDGTG